jgi:hypothetical protein
MAVIVAECLQANAHVDLLRTVVCGPDNDVCAAVVVAALMVPKTRFSWIWNVAQISMAVKLSTLDVHPTLAHWPWTAKGYDEIIRPYRQGRRPSRCRCRCWTFDHPAGPANAGRVSSGSVGGGLILSVSDTIKFYGIAGCKTDDARSCCRRGRWLPTVPREGRRDGRTIAAVLISSDFPLGR